MTTTLGAVKTAIARRLLDEAHTAVTEAEIVDEVNSAIKHYKNKRFWFNTTSADLSITAGDTEVILPADYLFEVPRNALIVYQDSDPYRLTKVVPLLFDAERVANATGRPRIYVSRDGGLEFAPAADRDYSGKLYYIKDYDDFPTDATGDTLTNDFLDDAEEMIRSRALANLSGELRQDDGSEGRFTLREKDAYNTLIGRTNQILKTGKVTVEQ